MKETIIRCLGIIALYIIGRFISEQLPPNWIFWAGWITGLIYCYLYTDYN